MCIAISRGCTHERRCEEHSCTLQFTTDKFMHITIYYSLIHA